MSDYLDFGTPISFGWTAQYLDRKTATRREWKDSHAAKFCNAFDKAAAAGKQLRVPAIDKGYHAGGKQIGWCVIRDRPFKQRLWDMDISNADLMAEGGMCASVAQFINRYFPLPKSASNSRSGDLREVWVIQFEFIPLPGVELEFVPTGDRPLYQRLSARRAEAAREIEIIKQSPRYLWPKFMLEMFPEPELEKEVVEPPASSPVIFSPEFLAKYPPYFGDVRYKADMSGQLNLLEFVETDDEPPDPDDFESLNAFRDAIALWDAQHPKVLEFSSAPESSRTSDGAVIEIGHSGSADYIDRLVCRIASQGDRARWQLASYLKMFEVLNPEGTLTDIQRQAVDNFAIGWQLEDAVSIPAELKHHEKCHGRGCSECDFGWSRETNWDVVSEWYATGWSHDSLLLWLANS